MAVLYYQAFATDLDVFVDPQRFTKEFLQDQYTTLRSISDLPDQLRDWIRTDGLPSAGIDLTFDTLAEFDEWLQTEFERFADILDVFDYETRIEALEVADGAWFDCTFESANDALPAQPGELGVDGNDATFWESHFVGTREYAVLVREHPKTMQGVRLLLGPLGDAKSQLQNVVIRAALDRDDLDLAASIVATGVDFNDTGAAYMEALFPAAVRARYVRLDITQSAALISSHVRIYELQVRVGTTLYEAVE